MTSSKRLRRATIFSACGTTCQQTKTWYCQNICQMRVRAKGKQRSIHIHAQRMHKPHALVKKSLCRSETCLSSHAIGAQQVWLQLHICYCIAQHQVTMQASSIACHEGGEEHSAWLTCSALATPRRVTSCFVTSTCLYASGSARLSCNPLSSQLLAAALLAA